MIGQESALAIKPSGMPYDQLTPEEKGALDFEGNIVEGRIRPSTDQTHAGFIQIDGIHREHRTYAFNLMQYLAQKAFLKIYHFLVPLMKPYHCVNRFSLVPIDVYERNLAILLVYETRR